MMEEKFCGGGQPGQACPDPVGADRDLGHASSAVMQQEHVARRC